MDSCRETNPAFITVPCPCGILHKWKTSTSPQEQYESLKRSQKRLQWSDGTSQKASKNVKGGYPDHS